MAGLDTSPLIERVVGLRGNELGRRKWKQAFI